MEEERQRRLAQEAQTQMAQNQLGAMSEPAAPIQNVPEVEELPMTEDLSESDSFQNALSNLMDSYVDRINRGESFLPCDKNRKKQPDETYDDSPYPDYVPTEDEQTQVTGDVEPVDSKPVAENEQEPNYLEESMTGGAAPINREKENPLAKQNNDDFFELERLYEKNGTMKINAEMNKDRPDAKLFMDIALTHPKNVPSCKDYEFISSKMSSDLNKKYDLQGNKKIPGHYDGFQFSESSPTAQRLNSSSEFRSQILSSKNFDSSTGTFKSNKLEIEFNDDKNLGYSFGHMTIINPKITQDGYIVGLGYDLYNYEGKGLNEYRKNKKAMILNNSAKALQMSGHLKNYFILVPIKVKI